MFAFAINGVCQLSSISGPLSRNDEYLFVVDYHQKNVYQLKPDSGEVRAIPMSPCYPLSVAFDPSINSLYMICGEIIGGKIYYRIRKKTVNGKINKPIYSAPQGVFSSQESLLLCLSYRIRPKESYCCHYRAYFV